MIDLSHHHFIKRYLPCCIDEEGEAEKIHLSKSQIYQGMQNPILTQICLYKILVFYTPLNPPLRRHLLDAEYWGMVTNKLPVESCS